MILLRGGIAWDGSKDLVGIFVFPAWDSYGFESSRLEHAFKVKPLKGTLMVGYGPCEVPEDLVEL